MDILPSFLWCISCMQWLWRPEEGNGQPEGWAAVIREPSCEWWESNLWKNTQCSTHWAFSPVPSDYIIKIFLLVKLVSWKFHTCFAYAVLWLFSLSILLFLVSINLLLLKGPFHNLLKSKSSTRRWAPHASPQYMLGCHQTPWCASALFWPPHLLWDHTYNGYSMPKNSFYLKLLLIS